MFPSMLKVWEKSLIPNTNETIVYPGASLRTDYFANIDSLFCTSSVTDKRGQLPMALSVGMSIVVCQIVMMPFPVMVSLLEVVR